MLTTYAPEVVGSQNFNPSIARHISIGPVIYLLFVLHNLLPKNVFKVVPSTVGLPPYNLNKLFRYKDMQVSGAGIRRKAWFC
jgi:hypothetical protein